MDKDPIKAAAGRIGAHVTLSRHDAKALTAPARATFLARFLTEVDPDGTLPEVERVRRAEHARKAHMARLAMLSVAARQARTPMVRAMEKRVRRLSDFLDEVDPSRSLPEDERLDRAEHARDAFISRASMQAAKRARA